MVHGIIKNKNKFELDMIEMKPIYLYVLHLIKVCYSVFIDTIDGSFSNPNNAILSKVKEWWLISERLNESKFTFKILCITIR